MLIGRWNIMYIQNQSINLHEVIIIIICQKEQFLVLLLFTVVLAEPILLHDGKLLPKEGLCERQEEIVS